MTGAYEVTVTDTVNLTTCFTAMVTPASWTARDAQELAEDVARCLKPGHAVAVVAAAGPQNAGRAES